MAEHQSLIGVTGLARSGKSEAVRYIHTAYGYEVVTASGLIRASLQQESGRTTFARDELRQRGDELRRLYGADFVVTHAHNLGSERVVIDGLRNKEAVRSLGHYGGILIGITADIEARFARDQQSNDGKPHYTRIEDMIQDEAKELRAPDERSLGVLDVLDMVHPERRIDTTYLSIEDVRSEIDRILQSITQLQI